MCVCGVCKYVIILIACVNIANADIYFDETLERLPLPLNITSTNNISNANTTANNTSNHWHNTILALTKWIDKGTREHMQLYLRTDSQDAWVFQSPWRYTVLPEEDQSLSPDDGMKSLLDIEIGIARCDNRIAYIITHDPHFQSMIPYHIRNTPFAIHAIEYDNRSRSSELYSAKGAAVGDGQHVLYSDNVYTIF